MMFNRSVPLIASVSAIVAVAAARNDYNLRPFQINLTQAYPKMRRKIEDSRLPEHPEYPLLGDTAGIDLDVLKNMRKEWLDGFDWEKEQASMNEFEHFLANIEGLTIHFIHQKSSQSDAIPLILNHGWPGSFLEFVPTILPLTESAITSSGKPVSFHVIVPSLPGFAFSSAPPANWTTVDTARVFNVLMTEVLGYEQFAVFGTDWGSAPAYSLYENYNQSTRAAHFAFIPFLPIPREDFAEQNVTLSSSLLEFEQEQTEAWSATGNAYLLLQNTKPNTIGLALYDNPVGQLAWIGEKFINWSDPRAGTGPSLLTHNEILRSVSLYYLTRSFVSSVFIYFQNAVNGGFRTKYTKAKTDAPMLYSAFKYNVGFWPPDVVAKVGNLVAYFNHDFGGHFPGIDNPAALVRDLREIGEYWKG